MQELIGPEMKNKYKYDMIVLILYKSVIYAIKKFMSGLKKVYRVETKMTVCVHTSY